MTAGLKGGRRDFRRNELRSSAGSPGSSPARSCFNLIDEDFNPTDESFNRIDEGFNRIDEDFNRIDEDSSRMKR